jgi:hypothetical protein
MKINQTDASTNKLRVVRWVINIITATIADSPIPTMANPVKINKTVIVDMVILIPELYYAGNAFLRRQ